MPEQPMQSIENVKVREALLQRFRKLNADALPKWGRMNAQQMIVHCDLQIQIAIGRFPVRDVSTFLTRTIGKFIVLNFYFLEWKNLPTARELNMLRNDMTITTDVKVAIDKLNESVNAFCQWNENAKPLVKHPILGALSKKQWGRLIAIHLDYHLKQFNQ
jgi:hypothetical protein